MNSDSYSVCSTFGGFRDEEPIRCTRHRFRRLASTRLGAAVLRLHFAGGHADGLRAPGLLRCMGRLSAPRVSRQRWLRLHELRLACPQLQLMRAELRITCAKLRLKCAELRFAGVELLPALLRSSVALHHSEHR